MMHCRKGRGSRDERGWRVRDEEDKLGSWMDGGVLRWIGVGKARWNQQGVETQNDGAISSSLYGIRAPVVSVFGVGRVKEEE